MIPDMDKILRAAMKDLQQIEAQVNCNIDLKTRMLINQLIKSIETALNVCLINVNEIMLKGKMINIQVTIDLTREEISELNKKQDLIKKINEDILDRQKNLEEYNKAFIFKMSKLWEEKQKNGRKKNKHNN